MGGPRKQKEPVPAPAPRPTFDLLELALLKEACEALHYQSKISFASPDVKKADQAWKMAKRLEAWAWTGNLPPKES